MVYVEICPRYDPCLLTATREEAFAYMGASDELVTRVCGPMGVAVARGVINGVLDSSSRIDYDRMEALVPPETNRCGECPMSEVHLLRDALASPAL